MASPVLSKPAAVEHRPLASPWHTVFIVVVQASLSYRAMMHASEMQNGSVDRIQIYTRTIFFEWLMFGLVILGVYLHGASILTVVGDRWRSLGHALQHLGIGVLFLIATVTFTSILGEHAHGDSTQYLMPQGHTERWMWIVLSISAGFCEEALFRGYLQRQFIALTKNVPAGIVLSAAAFGAAHAYQGSRQAIQIGVLGLMGGVLAHLCKNVRPGMIAHALQDTMAIFVPHS